MKKLIATLIASLFCAAAANADDAVNKKCPMSGKDVVADQTTTVSVTVGFCCEKCQAKFEGDAKAKADAVKKYAGSKETPANKKCAMNAAKDASKDHTATASTTVAFCCEKCKAEFEKDVKKNMAKVK